MNAATLALIDAGIPLRAYACACSASMAWRNGEPEPLVDVGHVEEAAGGVVLTVASLPSTGKFRHMQVNKSQRSFDGPVCVVFSDIVGRPVVETRPLYFLLGFCIFPRHKL